MGGRRVEGLVLCLVLFLMLSSCSKIRDVLEPGNGSVGDFLHIAQWQPPIDVQSPSNATAGHVDVTNVTVSYPEGKAHETDEGQIINSLVPFRRSLVVVAWQEMGLNGKWGIGFRVIWWDENHQWHTGLVQRIMDPNFDLTYPAITATYFIDLLAQVPPVPSLDTNLTVDIAYERPNGPGDVDICYQRYVCDNVENNNYDVFVPGPSPVLHQPFAQYTCRHPDIIYYSHIKDSVMCDGDEVILNTGLETVFIVNECETPNARCLEGWYIFNPTNPVIFAWQPKPPPGGNQKKPEYPRIDAGKDYSYPIPHPCPDPGDPLYFPREMVTTVWHYNMYESSTVTQDYDWDYMSLDISQWPFYQPAPYYPPPNDPDIWAAYPYVDFDPIVEQSANLHPSAHIVYTRGEDATNVAFDVYYTDSMRLRYAPFPEENLFDSFPFHGTIDGMATIAMNNFQHYTNDGSGDTFQDFDVYFISNWEDGVFRYYSKKFYFENLDGLGYYDIHFIGLPDYLTTRIHNLGLPMVSYYPDPPVGAIFDVNSEFVTYKHWAVPPNNHHIYGNYELY